MVYIYITTINHYIQLNDLYNCKGRVKLMSMITYM